MTTTSKRTSGNGETRWPEHTQGLHGDIERHREEIDRTLSELENKLSPQDLMEQLMRQMSDGPGTYLKQLSGAAKQNPVPLALVGVGLGWLMLGGNDHAGADRSTGKDADATGRDSPLGTAGGGAVPSGAAADLSDDLAVSDLYAFCLRREYPFYDDELECLLYDDLGPDAAAAWSGNGAERSSMAGHGEGQTSVGEQARARAGAAASEVRARTDRTRARMSEVSAEARSKIDRARENARRRALKVKHHAARGAREAGRQTSEIVDRYPLSLVALGVAAGAALGAGAPSTRAEDRWMGETSDTVKRRAADAARESAQSAKSGARAAVDAAADEARNQGLHPDDIKQGVQHARERASAVAGAAGDEAERQGASDFSAHDQARDTRERIEQVAVAAGDAARRELDDRESAASRP